MIWPPGLRLEDLNENPCPGCRVCFSHDVFDVFLDGLFGNFQSIRYFLIGPSLGKIFNHRLLSICQLKSFLGLIRIELLPATQLFQCDHKACVLNTASVWEAKTSKKHGLVWVSRDFFDLKLLPVLCLRANLERFQDFGAELSKGGWEHSLSRFRWSTTVFCHIDEFG